MKTAAGTGLVLVRFEAGEDIVAGLLMAFDQLSADAASVTGMVGSLQRVEYATAVCDTRGRPGYSPSVVRNGPIEIGSAQGQLGRDSAGQPELHLHGVFVTSDGAVFGGHVIAANVLVTVEVALIPDRDVGWSRDYVRVKGSDPLPVLQPINTEGNP